MEGHRAQGLGGEELGGAAGRRDCEELGGWDGRNAQLGSRGAQAPAQHLRSYAELGLRTELQIVRTSRRKERVLKAAGYLTAVLGLVVTVVTWGGGWGTGPAERFGDVIAGAEQAQQTQKLAQQLQQLRGLAKERPLTEKLALDDMSLGLDMLANAPSSYSSRGRSTPMGWLGWNDAKMEKEEEGIKDRVMKIETAMANQQKPNDDLSLMIDETKGLFGTNGVLKMTVNRELDNARAKLQRYQHKFVDKPKIRKFLDQMWTVRHGIKSFLKKNKAKDAEQDARIRALQRDNRDFSRRTKRLKGREQRKYRRLMRNLKHLNLRIKDLDRKYNWWITKGIYRRRRELAKKGRRIRKRWFRRGGDWDRAVNNVTAHLDKGMSRISARWDYESRKGKMLGLESQWGVDNLQAATEEHIDTLDLIMKNLRKMFAEFRPNLHLAVTTLNATVDQTAGEIKTVQDNLDRRGERIGAALDPCLGVGLASHTFELLLNILMSQRSTKAIDDQQDLAALQQAQDLFYHDQSEMIRNKWEQSVVTMEKMKAARHNATESEIVRRTSMREQKSEDTREERLKDLLDERALILEILKMLDTLDFAGASTKAEDLLHRGSNNLLSTEALSRLATMLATHGKFEEVSEVRKLLLEMLEQLDRDQLLIEWETKNWKEILEHHNQLLKKWKVLLDKSSTVYIKLEQLIRELEKRAQIERSEFQYHSSEFKRRHRAFLEELAIYNSQVKAVRLALKATTELMQKCEKRSEGHVPAKVARSAVASESWEIIMDRIAQIEKKTMDKSASRASANSSHQPLSHSASQITTGVQPIQKKSNKEVSGQIPKHRPDGAQHRVEGSRGRVD